MAYQIAHRQTGAGEEIVRGLVEADAGADVPLHVVAEQHGEAAVEVVLGVVRVGAGRHEDVPFRVAADAIGPRAADRPRLREFRRRSRAVTSSIAPLHAGRAAGRPVVVDVPAVQVIESGQHFVGGELGRAGGHRHLQNERRFRQDAFLRRQGELHAQAQVLGPGSRILDAADLVVLVSDSSNRRGTRTTRRTCRRGAAIRETNGCACCSSPSLS